jgi:hypothetical protein
MGWGDSLSLTKIQSFGIQKAFLGDFESFLVVHECIQDSLFTQGLLPCWFTGVLFVFDAF